MSQPKRYGDKVMPGRGINWQGFDYVMIEDDTGPWVSHSDYAALAAELDKWREEHSQLVYENKVVFPTRIGVLQKGLADAAAENERLWKYTVDLLQQVSAVRNLSDSEKELIAAAKKEGGAK